MAYDVEHCDMTDHNEMPRIKATDGFRVDTNHVPLGTNVADMEAATPYLDPAETALILTCLSKGYSTPIIRTPEDLLSDPDDPVQGPRHVHQVQQIHFDGPTGSKLDFTDAAGCNHRFRNESNRVKSFVTKHISIEELRAHFDRPIVDVAKDFGICITLMKKICRRNGIKRWPHRQIRSLSKSIASMEAAMLSGQGTERDKYRDQIANLKMKRDSVIADPNKDNATQHKIRPPSALGDAGDSGFQTCHPVTSTPSARPVQDVDALVLNRGSVSPSVKIENLVVSTSSASSCITSAAKGGRWTSEEHAAFLQGIRLYGKDWRRVAQVVQTRSAVQTRTHAQKYLLKFAGRFPMETDGAVKVHNPMQCDARDKSVTSLLSPTTSAASSPAMQPPVHDDSLILNSWTSKDVPPIAKHGEAMAMILNGSPPVESAVKPREVPLKAMTTLPSLPSRTSIKPEQTAAACPYPWLQGAVYCPSLFHPNKVP